MLMTRGHITRVAGVLLLLPGAALLYPLFGWDLPAGTLGDLVDLAIAVAIVSFVAGVWLLVGLPVLATAAWAAPLAVASLVNESFQLFAPVRIPIRIAIGVTAISLVIIPRLAERWCRLLDRIASRRSQG